MRSVTLALLFVAFLSPLSALDVECDYDYPYTWMILGKVLTCSINNLKVVIKNENITEVTGNLPLRDDTNATITLTKADVKMLNIIGGSVCEHMPSGFENHFPNLEGIRFGGTRLAAITHDDLKVFPKLRYLDAWNNNVDMLESNLFNSTPNVEYLYFGDNSIRFIGYNTFAPLKNLTYATFQSNTCIHDNAHTKEEVQALIQKAHAQCTPNEEIIDKSLCGDKMKQLVSENDSFRTQSESLLKIIQDMSGKNSIMRHQNANLSSENIMLSKKVEQLEREIAGVKNSKGSHEDVDMENKINMLENENHALNFQKTREDNSSAYKWILMTLGVVAIVGCAIAYLKHNQLMLFRGNFISERLT